MSEFRSMNLSNTELIEKSLSRMSLNFKNSATDEEEGDFAFIDSVPSGLQYAINISQVYAKKSESDLKYLKLKFYLQTDGMKLHRPIFKILKLRKEENFDVWQMEKFDELVSLGVDICKLNDKDIELVVEVIGGGKGMMKIFKGSVLKSGLNISVIEEADFGTIDSSGAADTASADTTSADACTTSNICATIMKLEKALYMRKSKEVANWQIQLMKEKLKEEEIF